MANPWDENYSSGKNGSEPWNAAYHPDESSKSRTAGQIVSDLGVSFAGGANSLVEGLGTLYGMATGDMDNIAREQGESGRKYWDARKSEALKADEAGRRAAIDSADGELAKAGTAFWETVKNPALFSSFAAEQIPMFLPIGVAGRAGTVAAEATGVAGKVANIATKAGDVAAKSNSIPARIAQKGLSGISTAEGAAGTIGTATGIGAGAALQGADVGSDAYSEIMKLPDSLWEHNQEYQSLRADIGDQKAKEQVALDLARQSASEGGVASVLTNLLPFARTFERVTAGAPAKLTGNFVSRAAKGAAGESMQEASEEGLGRVSVNRAVNNIDPSRSLTEGVGEAAGMGAAGGVVMGGTFGALSKDESAPVVDPNAPTLTRAAQIAGRGIGVPAGSVQADSVRGPQAGQENSATSDGMSILTGASPSVSANTGANQEISGADNSTLAAAQSASVAESAKPDVQTVALPNEGAAPAQSVRYAGNPSEVVLPDNTTLNAQWEIVDADQVTATLKEGKNQPRDRSRAASNVQVQGIANNPDYRRLSDSPVMDIGAPTISHDGAIVGGNGRFEGVSRAYDQGTAGDYLAKLKADAAVKGIDPAVIDTMKKPVLVRRVTQPFDTRALAVASNSGGSLQYSALELAKIDGDRMTSLGDVEVDDSGDIVMTADNIGNVRRSLAGYSASELGSMTDKDGLLSQEGLRRIKNAMIYKAYGSNPTLSRIVESTDNDMRSVSGALIRAAGSVAKVRANIDGSGLDIAADIVAAVEKLGQIKQRGQKVEQYLAQDALFGKELTPEAVELMQYFSDNIRSQKRMAEFIVEYYNQLSSIDNKTAALFGDMPQPTKQERLKNAIQTTKPEEAGSGRSYSEVGAQNKPQSNNPAGDQANLGQAEDKQQVGSKSTPVSVESRDHIKLAEQQVNTSPTEAQKESGNYAKGHIVWNGIPITIENPAGSKRSGIDSDGERWNVTMPASYGYIKQTEGADGDHVDVYIGKHMQSDLVFVIDQKDVNTGRFDEHKVMLGFPTKREAERTYKLGFSDRKGAQRIGAVTQMTVAEFKEWLKKEDTTKPAAKEQASPARQQDKIIGRNYEGIMIREDANGVRYIHRNGVKLQEKVLLDGRGGYSVDRTESLDSDFMPVDQEARAKAKDKIDGALAELGSIFRDVANVQNITPEEKAKLLPALVKLFEGAFELGLYNMKDARAFVREQLAKFDAKLSKFLDNKLMDEAAMQAQKNMPDGFADNQGLFGASADKPTAKESLTPPPEASTAQAGNVKQADRSDQFRAYENFIKSKGAISPELAQEISRDKALGAGEAEALLAMGKEDAASRENEHVQDRMTNADKKLNPDNFKVPPLHTVVSPEIEHKAHDLIAKYKTAEHKVTLDPADVKIAEEAIAPILAKAEKNLPAFKDAIIEIAHAAGIGQMVAGIKRRDRCVEKMLNPADAKKYVVREKIDLFSSRLISVKAEENLRDTLRATVVVKSYGDADAVISEIRKHFEIIESRHKDRVAAPTPEGYRDHLLNVILPDGLQAEIQINTPEMLAAKDIGHALYEVSQNYSLPGGVRSEASGTQRELYGAAYTASNARSLDTGLLNSGMMPSVNTAISPPIATTRPSGSLTNGDSSSGVKKNLASDGSLATNSRKVFTPSNPTGSGFISGSSKHIVAKNASGVHNQDLFSSENTTEGAQDGNESAGAGRTQGKGAAASGAAKGKRKSGSVRQGIGARDIVRNTLPLVADSDQTGIQRPGQDSAGAVGDTQRGGADGAGDRTGGAAGLPAGQPREGVAGVVDGRAGRAIPAGRDIPAKSGKNYRITDADLDYAGSWITKATQNVEAVELVKKLEKEGRQATREEQAVLAKFIGWGASEIRNKIFDPQIDKVQRKVDAYNNALQWMKDAKKETLTRFDYSSPYHTVFQMLQAAGVSLPWSSEITKPMLEKLADKEAQKWLDLRGRLKELLTEDEWTTAERSTQYAHYTGKEVVNEMWRASDRMGFKGGAILEPGAGIGVFPGLMPAEVAANSIYTGIEYDALTGAILKHLQPDERTLTESFVDSALPDNFYDVAIGNPPFSNTKILTDTRYKKHAFALHDYFFAKTMDKVKPGGLVMFVTSRHTMDKQGDKARQYLAERADLLGAIRLPQTAFQKNAGTEVVTDILFLRKKVPGETFEGHGWIGLENIKIKGGEHQINEYFSKHPEMVLGEGAIESGQFGKQYTVLPNKSVPITELLARAVENLPRDVFRPAEESSAKAAQVRQLDFNPKAKKEGNYYVGDDGNIMQVENRIGVPAKVAAKDVPLLKDFVALRDALNQAQHYQLNNGDWEKSLKALHKAYKAFVKKHGNLMQNTVVERKVMVEDEDGNEVADIVSSRRFTLVPKINDDPEYSKVLSLESLNEDTGEITESDFLTKRTLELRNDAKISTPHDALLSTLNDIGRVDIPMIAERIGLSEADTINALGSAIYESPSGGWVMEDEYLSGNVKKKLKEAQAAAKSDRRFERNVDALMNAQPSPVPPSDITASLGMNWIPSEVYEQFLLDNTGVKARIAYNEHTGNWSVNTISGNRTVRATVDWGTNSRPADEILEASLTGRPIRITRTEGSGADKKTVFDAAATEAAVQKQKEMRQAFSDWMWQDKERTEKLVTLYNDKFNTTVSRKFDGRHLTLPGTTSTIKVFDHVKRGAWRIIQSGNTYLAHAVGSGKTWEMVISAMEQKRLGMISKPMAVVPNHMLQQFAQEWLQLYPAARLMVADEKQFHTENRRRFISRVAMSDLDGVIITHSAFKLLDLDPEFKDKMMNEQLDYYRAALEEVQDAEGETGDAKKSRSPKVRDIQNRIEKLEEKLSAKMSGAGKDSNVRFDEMGVDFLYVDEAHEYRKLEFATVRQVKGISSTGSDKAFDLYMKSRWLEEKNPGRSMVMASGTPVTNTMAEMYSVQRFMQPKALEEKGLQDFDAWASMFGEEITEIEADASGKYAPVTRFAHMVNVPELTQMFREFADVLTSEHLAEMLGDMRPKVKYGARKMVITPQVDEYLDYKQELARRLEKSKQWKPSRDEPNNPDPVIRIIGDGRLASIDMRFIDPSLQSNPASKLNVLIDGVIKSYKKYAKFEYEDKNKAKEDVLGASQMVFSDIGFGAGVAAHRGFDARAWFEKRLKDAGIPAAHIAFMADYKKSDAKVKLFKDVNAGRVRILVGSSKNMGTGVNAQQRLRVLHHLDTPWYPADLEQREGRIIRQKNKNKHVRIYAYSTKGSYDTNMWQLLARKQRFIDQALSGDSSVRRLEDISEASQFQMATAMTAGDERAIRLAGLKSDIDRYQRLYRAHEETRMRLKQEITSAKYAINRSQEKLPEAEKMASKVKDLSGDKFEAALKMKRKEFGESLLAKLKSLSDKITEGVKEVGSISGFPIVFIGNIDRNNDGKVLGYYSRLEVKIGEDAVILSRDPSDDPVGLSIRATNALTAIERKPAELRQAISDAKSKINANESRVDAPFQFAQEMADRIKEAKELEAEMQADQKDYSNSELVQKAKAFAEKHHGDIDQRRKFTNEPYITHPQGVVDVLKTAPHTEEMLAAAWAHDTVEDTKATIEDVRAELGDKVADLVQQLTKPYPLEKMTPDAQTIKLADIVHNASASHAAPAEFSKRYLAEKSEQLAKLTAGDKKLWAAAKIAIEGGADPAESPLASQAKKKTEGMSVERVVIATAKLRASWVGFRRIRVVQSVSDIPTDLYLRALRNLKPIDVGTEGIYDPVTRTVYLIADNIDTPARAVWVAAHEVVGHGGIRMLGGPVIESLNFAGKNGFVVQLAKAIAKDRGEEYASRAHVDEAMAELAASTITGKADEIFKRYKVNIPAAMRGGVIGLAKRLIDAIRKFFTKALSVSAEEVKDSDIYAMLRKMQFVAEGKDLNKDGSDGIADDGLLASKSGASSIIDSAILAWKGVVKSYIDGTLDKTKNAILLPATPASMQVIGLPDLPVRIKGVHALDHINARISVEDMGMLPGEISDPKLVYFYRGIDGKSSLNFVTGLKTGSKHIVVAIHPSMHTPQSGKAHYMATVMDVEAHKINAIVKSGATMYVGDLNAIPGMRAAFEIAKRENGREAVNLRELASQTFSLLATVDNRVKHKSAAVKMIDSGDALFSVSTATKQNTAAGQLRAPNKNGIESDTGLIDKAFKAPFRLLHWNNIVSKNADRILSKIGDLIPETVKAGVVDNYGIDSEYIDSKADMQAREAAQNRKAHGMVEMLAGLTRAESRVAYYWMQEQPGSVVEQQLMDQLPEKSRETLENLKKLISDMGKEAVRLGQMSQESYERNNMAYLHRTYAKHVLAEDGWLGNYLRARAIKIKGNQYKGRGIFDEVPASMLGGDLGFGRKMTQGQADKQLIGKRVIRLENRDSITEAIDALPGMTGKPLGKLREVVYWPEGEAIPAKYGDWRNAGSFEVRNTKGDKLVVWRDLTREERERLGELDEVRYAVAQTLQMMIHDVEVGRFLEWTASKYGKAKPEGKEVAASESMLKAYHQDEWVQVPSSNIPGTQTKKYGALAGVYVPGSIWNDIRQTAGGRIQPFGKTYANVLGFWKKSKTVWSPGVHMNNVMANFVMADWNDVRAVDMADALRVWSQNDKAGYKELFQRFEDSGALGGMFQSNEVMRDEIKQRLAELKADLTGQQDAEKEMGTMAKVLQLVSLVSVKPVKAYTETAAKLYQGEDAFFRLAVFLKAIRHGKTDIEAGRMARHAFLNYDINAPWVQMARQTVLPFISFFYRAAPMLYNTAKNKPWKIAKLVAFAYLVNALGYAIAGGGDDEDKDRKLMPAEKGGSVWGLVPKMIRMPWNHGDGSPVFLDIRRWVPVGDIVDMEMGAGTLPPWATPGGPLTSIIEAFMLNKSMFTEKEIVAGTDSGTEAAEKRMDYLFKSMMPNVPLPNPINLQIGGVSINPFNLDQGSFQSYGWSGIEKSVNRTENAIGEVRTTPAAIASAVGIKMSAFPRDNMEAAITLDFKRKATEIEANIKKLARDHSKLASPTKEQDAALERNIERQKEKLQKAQEEMRQRLE